MDGELTGTVFYLKISQVLTCRWVDKCVMVEGHIQDSASNLSCFSGTPHLKPIIALAVSPVIWVSFCFSRLV